MTNGKDCVYPFTYSDGRYNIVDVGLTKREAFAMAAMQGILASNPPYLFGNVDRPQPKAVAGEATIYADALIAALNQTPNP